MFVSVLSEDGFMITEWGVMLRFISLVFSRTGGAVTTCLQLGEGNAHTPSQKGPFKEKSLLWPVCAEWSNSRSLLSHANSMLHSDVPLTSTKLTFMSWPVAGSNELLEGEIVGL